jgi:hypothetical protein
LRTKERGDCDDEACRFDDEQEEVGDDRQEEDDRNRGSFTSSVSKEDYEEGGDDRGVTLSIAVPFSDGVILSIAVPLSDSLTRRSAAKTFARSGPGHVSCG